MGEGGGHGAAVARLRALVDGGQPEDDRELATLLAQLDAADPETTALLGELVRAAGDQMTRATGHFWRFGGNVPAYGATLMALHDGGRAAAARAAAAALVDRAIESMLFSRGDGRGGSSPDGAGHHLARTLALLPEVVRAWALDAVRAAPDRAWGEGQTADTDVRWMCDVVLTALST